MLNRNKGFTLIELMIVVAIIAILAAIALSAWREHNGGDVQYGTTGGTLADAPVSYLVCKDGYGAETSREPAIPGQQWEADGNNYVTFDANGRPHIVAAPVGGFCTIESQKSA